MSDGNIISLNPKTVTRQGNSLGVSIGKELNKFLDAEKGDEVVVAVVEEGGSRYIRIQESE